MATEETTITELELAEEVLADMVIPVDTSTDTKSVSLKQLRAWLGSSLPTGFIIASFGKMDDERFTLLDGKTLSKQGTYGAFCAKVEEQVQAGKWFACTEEEYNADLLANGQCSKFVVGVDYVRIPKLGNSLCSGVANGTIPIFGNGMTLGLTDGTKNYGATSTNAQYVAGLDSSYGVNLPSSRGGGTFIGTTSNIGITTNPTKSGIEGKINSVEVFYYMVISTEGQTAKIEIDINKVYEDLNLKANNDLSSVASVASSFKEQSVGWGMPDYSAGVTKTKDVNYTESVDGFVVVNVVGASQANTLIVGGNTYTLTTQGNYAHGILATFYVPKGSSYKYSGHTPNRYIFFPLKGVN